MHLGLSHPGPSEPIWPTEPAVSLEELDRIASKLDQNLIIWREDSEAIARAAQYLKAFWRSRHPDVAVKRFRGDQRLALLTHINQGIAEIGLNRALQTPSPPRSPSQMVLITHAEQLLSADVQMLQDLAVQLPGLRWRFVLLCIERSGEPTHAALTSLTLLNAQPRWTAVPAAHQPDARALTASLGQAPIMASALRRLRRSPAPHQVARPSAWPGLAWLPSWPWPLGAFGNILKRPTRCPQPRCSSLKLKPHPRPMFQRLWWRRCNHRPSRRHLHLNRRTQHSLIQRPARQKQTRHRPQRQNPPTQHPFLPHKAAKPTSLTWPCGAFVGWASCHQIPTFWCMVRFKPRLKPKA